jgi:signal transduction histidine kinase
MPQGGTLHLSVREFPRHKSPRGNLSVLVEIEDTGKGIPAKYMEDIWQPFFTTNQSGTGIGIPETRKIIDSMGGTMDIQSEEKVGTTVSFWLKGEHDE